MRSSPDRVSQEGLNDRADGGEAVVLQADAQQQRPAPQCQWVRTCACSAADWWLGKIKCQAGSKACCMHAHGALEGGLGLVVTELQHASKE